MSDGNIRTADQASSGAGRDVVKNSSWSHPIHWHPHIDLSMIKVHNPFYNSKAAFSAKDIKDPAKARASRSEEANGTEAASTQEAHHHWHWAFPMLPSPARYSTQGPPASSASTTWSHLACANVIAVQNAYIIEIETPGLRIDDQDRCTIEWMSPRSLVVAVDIPESETSGTLVAATERGKVSQVEDKESSEEDGGELSRVPSHDDICYLVKERHSGPWRRSFTLPGDAFTGPDAASGVGSTGGLKWEVEDGLLRVIVARRTTPSAP